MAGIFFFTPPLLAVGRCVATQDNILGPFYREGAPFKTKIAGPNEKGEPLKIFGKVLGLDCEALPGAVVDVWQADHEGSYDNSGFFQRFNPKEFKLRGRMKTNEKGHYEYETILPGAYKIGLNSWRPKHIHYIVTKPGFEPLTTQLYFSGDPYIEGDRFVKESLIIDLKKTDPDKKSPLLVGNFDIVLNPSKL
ncbi:MAG TPA: twin-arginine translocation pathway signal protein [Nitrospiria bacterium]